MARARTYRGSGLALALMSVLVSSRTLAHSGGLDREGGHVNRKTGEYHCHRAPCREREPERHERSREPREDEDAREEERNPDER